MKKAFWSRPENKPVLRRASNEPSVVQRLKTLKLELSLKIVLAEGNRDKFLKKLDKFCRREGVAGEFEVGQISESPWNNETKSY